jgi:hypothetical protein
LGKKRVKNCRKPLLLQGYWLSCLVTQVTQKLVMPKVKSVIKLSGTLDQLTFVRSHTYGDHVRRKRGSVKPAVVNDAFKKSSDELRAATPYAKLIKDSVNPYVIRFKDWTLWSRLRSFFRKQVREGSIDYHLLEGFEFHKLHSLYSLLRSKPLLKVNMDEGELCLSFGLAVLPHFPVRGIDGYKLTLVIIGISTDGTSSITLDHTFHIKRLNDNSPEEQIRFALKEPLPTFIIALKCEGCRKSEVVYNVKANGMAVIGVVEV